jgi:predicted ferric reductase
LINLLDLCSYFGLGAVGAITINLMLGALIALRYSPLRLWPHRRVNLFALHRWTAYAAMALALMHPAVLLLLHAPKFSVPQILWPIHSFLQPKLNFTGAIALYLLLIVLISSLLRSRIGRPLWRNLHYLVYPATVLLLVHSMLTDPQLKDGHPDLLDGGKVFIAISIMVILVIGILRTRYRAVGFRSHN